MKQIMEKFIVTVPLLLVSIGIFAESHGQPRFELGQEYYQSGNYEDAVTVFEEAVEISPENSTYHHWLGKSYGQLAVKAGIMKAYNLSLKTRDQLEQAVELDNNNIDALADLLKYYEQAPSFLGGTPEKTEEIRARLRMLDHQNIDKPEV